MVVQKFLSILFMVALTCFEAAADDHEGENLGVIELIPFSLTADKDMSDFKELKERFARTVRDLNADYRAWVLTPLFVTPAAPGITEKFDAVWLGASPSALAFAEVHAGT